MKNSLFEYLTTVAYLLLLNFHCAIEFRC